MLTHRYNMFVAASVMLTMAVLDGSSFVSAGRLECDPSTVTTTATSRSASCSFVMEDADDGMMGMASFSFAGMDNDNADEEPMLVYTKAKATQRTLDADGAYDVTWMGSGSGEMGQLATLVQMPSGAIAGSFRTATSAFMLMPEESGGRLRLQETYWADAMESGIDDDAAVANDEGATAADALDGRSNESMMPAAVSVVLPQSDDTTVSMGDGVVVAPDGDANNRNLRNRDLQSITTIDVLVIATNRAMCESARLSPGCALTASSRAPLESALRVVEAETTAGMQDVGVAVAVRFAQIMYLAAGGYDGRPSVSALDVLRNDPNVAQWRNDAGADLVALVTGEDPGRRVGGIAYLEMPQSVTSWTQLQYYAMVCTLMCFWFIWCV